MKNYRILLLPLSLLIAAGTLLPAQVLQPRLDGAVLRVTAPQLRFLSGRILEKLHNGIAVPFVFHLRASSGGRMVVETSTRYVLSFDLWEEKFSVLQIDGGQRSVTHLGQEAAEAWCLENLGLSVSAFAGEGTYLLKLEIRVEETRGQTTNRDNGFSMIRLIELFSRKAREEPLSWSAVSGPVRLDDLGQKNPNQKLQVFKP
jgi:hypothetical protein